MYLVLEFPIKKLPELHSGGRHITIYEKHSISALLRCGSRGNRTPLNLEQIKLGTPLLPCDGLSAAEKINSSYKNLW
jgi:hypothetical protein